jgi:hypothetical protein
MSSESGEIELAMYSLGFNFECLIQDVAPFNFPSISLKNWRGGFFSSPSAARNVQGKTHMST